MDDNYLNDYKGFVDQVTSDPSKDVEVLIARLRELNGTEGINIARLMTAGIGLASEGGEFDEIIKKLVFQGKPLTEDVKFHLFRELGDIQWYWMQACLALGVSPKEVMDENIRKLEARYPGGFEAFRSENRKAGDI